MNNYVSAVCKSVHYHIRALCHICSSISEDMAKMVACALVSSRLDYANSILFGATQKNISKLKKLRTFSPVLLPVLLNHAVRVLSSSSSTGSRLNTASTSKIANITFRTLHFYRAMLCIRGTTHDPVSVCLCLSVASRSSTKTAKRRITQTTPHDSPGTLVF